jgi:hypothetical protein
MNVLATSVETSSVPEYTSLKRTPDDICNRCRIEVRPYSASASAGTYVATGSSTERMRPSAIATPINIEVTVFAIDHDVKRSRSVRPYC